MSRPESLSRRRAVRGMSLVELMAALVVSLLVSLAAMSSAQLFNASQRQGVGMGSNTVAVAGALSAIKQDIAQAGLGFFGESSYLCERLNLAIGGTVYSNNGAFSPVAITREGSGSDRLMVAHADSIAAGSNIRLANSTDGITAAQLRTFLPLPDPIPAGGVAALLAPAPGSAAPLCTIRSITASTPVQADGTPLTVNFGNTGTNNGVTFSTQPTYVPNDRIALLGGQLSLNVYRVDANRNLVVDQPLGGANGVILARNVLAFRVEYGVSADTLTDMLAQWLPASTGANWVTPGSTEIERIRALRIGIVTRSTEKEKPRVPGDDSTCEASTSKPSLFPTVAGEVIEPDVAAWRCYRYKVVTAVVPLRNLVMGK